MATSILVTGGAGYIGSILVPKLLRAGHSVTVLDNFMYGQASLNDCAIHPKFKVMRGDVRDDAVIKEAVKGVDVIIPLAALVGAPICKSNPVGARTINRDAIFTMLEHISLDQLVIMPTTNSAYGTGDDNNYCDETTSLNPISQYAVDKVEVEKRLLEHPRAISFRLATVFGMSPRMRTDLLVNDFVYRAVNDKFVVLFEAHFKRNYIHVRDVARLFLHALNNADNMCGEIYNAGLSSANLSKKELCEEIKQVVSDFTYIEAPIGKDPDQRNYIVSNEKIEKTGFTTDYDIRTGIIELTKGYQMLRNSKYGNI